MADARSCARYAPACTETIVRDDFGGKLSLATDQTFEHYAHDGRDVVVAANHNEVAVDTRGFGAYDAFARYAPAGETVPTARAARASDDAISLFCHTVGIAWEENAVAGAAPGTAVCMGTAQGGRRRRRAHAANDLGDWA